MSSSIPRYFLPFLYWGSEDVCTCLFLAFISVTRRRLNSFSFIPRTAGTHFRFLLHSQGGAGKAKRVGGPNEPGKLVRHPRVPCEGV